MGKDQELELWRYLESQRDLAARLIEGKSLDDVAPCFISSVVSLLRWDSGALWEAGEGEPILRFVSGWSVADFDAESLWRHSRELTVEPGYALPGRAWSSGQIALVPSIGDEAEVPRRQTASELGITAALAIPVPIGRPENVVAVAEFHTRSFNAHAEELMGLLSGFADQLATFIGRRRAETKLETDRADAERVRQHMAEVVRSTQDAVISKDLDGIVTSWNPAAERMYGYSAAQAIGRHISFLVPSDHKNEEREILDRVLQGERLETYETERIRADGARIAVSLTVSQIRNPVQGVIGASVVARDITVAKRRRRAQEFLVAASRQLDTSLDPAQTARTIVGTAVPELAELCLIDFVRSDGWLGDSIAAAADPEAAARLEEIRSQTPLDPEGEHPVAQALRRGEPMIWRDLTSPEVADQIAQSEEHRQLMTSTGYSSAAVVPLVARGRTLGTLSFLHASPDLRYDDADLEFLSELGDRAAMALDNARLYGERDRIAANLQRGLRPPRPAEVPGLEISVVFEAAGEGIEIGGDFYDVLPTEDGCWVLIGDVAGKGSAAAGVSVATRHSVRGLVREVDEPEEVLRQVNELLLEGKSLNDLATVQLIRMRRDGDRWPLALASAGHTPAVHVSGHDAELLDGGTLLGAWADSEIQRHELVLHPGATLVLATDGWLEVGPPASHRTPEALAEMASSLAGIELDQLTARLRADAVERGAGSLRDDLVILAVRPRG
jgi:PAS domain S-box-containing protein